MPHILHRLIWSYHFPRWTHLFCWIHQTFSIFILLNPFKWVRYSKRDICGRAYINAVLDRWEVNQINGWWLCVTWELLLPQLFYFWPKINEAGHVKVRTVVKSGFVSRDCLIHSRVEHRGEGTYVTIMKERGHALPWNNGTKRSESMAVAASSSIKICNKNIYI